MADKDQKPLDAAELAEAEQKRVADALEAGEKARAKAAKEAAKEAEAEK